VDTGYSIAAYSSITDVKEVSSGELSFDKDTSKRITERRMYRRNRRNRLRYRKPRFKNRTKPKGWLPPSTKRKFDAQVGFIKKLQMSFPIKRLIVEIGEFDIQKLENPGISGVQYQQGDLFGYYNLKSYLLAREKGRCQLCEKKFTEHDRPHMHHKKPRSEGGSDRPDNIALIHKSCHKKLHEKKLFNKLKPAKSYKAATFMSIIGDMLKRVLGCEVTYGYETKAKREALELEKSHVNDAFVIAGGTTQERCVPQKIEQKRRNNRALQTNRKGFIPSIRRKRHPIQNRDFVWIDGKRYLCGGTACRGTQVYYFDGLDKKLISSKRVEKLYSTGGLVWVS
jgi:hypothetical protein